VWDISPDGGVEPIFFPHETGVGAIALHPNGSQLATAAPNGTAVIWDVVSGESLHTLYSDDWVWKVAYSPDGALLVTADSSSAVKLWDVESGRELSTVTGLPQQDEAWFFRGVLSVAFSPGGAWLATAGGDGAIRVWDVASLQKGDLEAGDELFVLQEPADLNWSYDLSFSADGRWIAASVNTYEDEFGNWRGGDGVVVVWDAETRRLLWTLGAGDGENPGNVAFSPDGDRLAVGHLTDGRVAVWQLPDDRESTPEELFTFVASKDLVSSLSFSPDGSQLAVPHSEGMGIWDANTGEFIKPLPHPFMTLEAVYSPDGKRLATAGFDGFGRLFVLDADELIALAQSRLTRSLTAEECQQFLHMDQCP
jgi:WD40 repeat protein